MIGLPEVSGAEERAPQVLGVVAADGSGENRPQLSSYFSDGRIDLASDRIS